MLQYASFIVGKTYQNEEIASNLGIINPNFQIVSIQQGGMGVCIRLESHETKKSYALKCINSDALGEKENIDRFLDEVNISLTTSSCDGVVEALRVIRINEIPAILSTWMLGGDLAHILPTLNSSEKIRIIIRTIRTLSWVLEKNDVIHRDIKPANILLDLDKMSYISDWGLARPLRNYIDKVNQKIGERFIERPDRTQAGYGLGTIYYASPEQLINAKMVDHRSDIYSLGCLMYEMETGHPPFVGFSPNEIIQKHLKELPAKIGGVFSKTNLGIERIIQKCLLKNPEDRYQTYDSLENEICEIIKNKNFPIDSCEVKDRYIRFPLGKGDIAQKELIKNARIKGEGYTLVEFEDLTPFLSEAQNLIALNRFSEAKNILGPIYNYSLIKNSSTWHIGHDIAVNYAYCLQNIPEYLQEALYIYSVISKSGNAEPFPAEFYINYSLALLQSNEWESALELCNRGIKYYPTDCDLLGNLTISLKHCGFANKAFENAKNRLARKRDIHAIEEMASLLEEKRDQLRNKNLPESIYWAENEIHLVNEGLNLNPNFSTLKLLKIRLFIFSNETDKAITICDEIINDTQASKQFRQLALIQMLKIISSGETYKIALDIIEKYLDSPSAHEQFNADFIDNLILIKMRIYADRFMIGMNTQDGERIVIPQVVDYFLNGRGGKNSDDFMCAKILEWLGENIDAEIIFRELLEKTPDNWDLIREYSLFLLRERRKNEALATAEKLMIIAPWKAESYDAISYIAEQISEYTYADEMKNKADEVFRNEKNLFEKFRQAYTQL